VYLETLNAPFIFDDIPKIVRNPDIKNFSTIFSRLVFSYKSERYRSFERNDPSRPVTYLTFALNYYFDGLIPTGYHLVNIILHAINAILLYIFISKLLSILKLPDKFNYLPFITSFLFAVHPVNTNVVSYVFARSSELATMFMLLSLIYFLKGAKSRIIFCSLFFILALFSKPFAVVLPFLTLAIDIIILKIDLKRSFRKNIHLIFILIIYLSFRYFYLGGLGDIDIAPELRWQRWKYFVLMPSVILRYIGVIFLVYPQCIYHDIKPVEVTSIYFWGAIIFIVILLLWGKYSYKQEKNGIVCFAILWFFITLAPTSSIFPTAIPMDEKRMYIAGIGIFLLISYYFLKILSFANRKVHFKIIIIFMILTGAVLIRHTHLRNKLYTSAELMWKDVLAKYNENYTALNSLAAIYMKQKQYKKALALLKRAIKLMPAAYETYINIGIAYYGLRQIDKSIESYKMALKLKPDSFDAHNNLAISLIKKKQYKEALKELNTALLYNRRSSSVYFNLAQIYTKLKKFTDAEKCYKKAIELKPDYIEAYVNISSLYYKLFSKEKKSSSLKSEYFNKAIKVLQCALKINPYHVVVLTNLGRLLRESGDIDAAIGFYSQAIDIAPNFYLPYFSLGVLYLKQNNLLEAEINLKKAVELYPDFNTLYSLMLVYLKMNKIGQAKKLLKKLYKINPTSKKLKKISQKFKL